MISPDIHANVFGFSASSRSLHCCRKSPDFTFIPATLPSHQHNDHFIAAENPVTFPSSPHSTLLSPPLHPSVSSPSPLLHVSSPTPRFLSSLMDCFCTRSYGFNPTLTWSKSSAFIGYQLLSHPLSLLLLIQSKVSLAIVERALSKQYHTMAMR